MKSAPCRRSLAHALVGAVAFGQLVLARPGVLAGTLATLFLAHGHGHALSLRPDAGHLDVVLHHEDEEGGGAPFGFGAHDGDHVVHGALADSARDGRRLAPGSFALVSAPAWRAPTAAPPLAAPHAHPAAPDSSALLRTVVLRV